MKKLTLLTSLLLILVLVMSLCACQNNANTTSTTSTDATETTVSSTEIETVNELWLGADYVEDTTLGTGKTTFECEVTVSTGHVTFTINTDKETVGEALLENELIAGEDSEYGLYVKMVDGITADYDKDGAYWAFYIDGEYASTGVDQTPIEAGKKYALVYTAA